jgi:hypothetical protein
MTETTYTSTDTPVRTELSGRPASDDPAASQEFARFRDLTRNLLAVPKEEVDEADPQG